MAHEDYLYSGLFPGPDGSGQTSANSHPYTYLDGGESITLGSNESGVYIPISNFAYGNPDALKPGDEAEDIRFFAWSILDVISSHNESRNVRSQNVTETTDSTDNGLRKQYTFNFNFDPLAVIPETDYTFFIDKPEHD